MVAAILWFFAESYSWRDRSLRLQTCGGPRRARAALLVGGLVFVRVSQVLLLVAFASPRMGSGSFVRGRGGARVAPGATTGVLRQIRHGALSRGGAGDVSFTKEVNMSPDSNNIFSQPQKRHQRADQTSRRASTRQDEPI